MTTIEQLKDDMRFALENEEEFKYSICPMLRYVAALNPEATKKEFIEAMIHFEVNPKTAAIQFWTSRKFDKKNYTEVERGY